MIIRFLISILFIGSLIVGCTSTEVEKIYTVTVNESYDVELSRAVTLPINLNDAILIMEECLDEYNTSLGEPELIDENWVFYYEPGGFSYFYISVNRNNGDVVLELYG